MIEITPYDYQEDIIGQVRKYISEGIKHIMVQLPTGGGKTVIFSYIAQKAGEKGNNVLIITDREELLSQAGKTIRQFKMNPAYIKAGAKYIDRRKHIFIAMSQTLRNRLNVSEWRDFIINEVSLIIIDEAHIQEFNHIFEDGILDGKKVLAFTATPSRGGKMRQLGLDYERLIRGASVRELIAKGNLLNCDLHEAEAPDMDGVKINSFGDYSEQSMFEKYDKPKTYRGLISNYKSKCAGKKMIVFCVNIEHAIKTTIELNQAGISAKFVCSEMAVPKPPKADCSQAETEKYNEKMRRYEFWRKSYEPYSGPRDEVIAAYHRRDFDAIVNVDMLTKGFDDRPTEVVAVCRSTLSLTLWLQMIGRGSRTSEETGKTHFIVLDFGGNKKRLGGYDDERNWSLWHEEKKSGGIAPLKECGITSTGKAIISGNEVEKGCKRLILASYQLCPFCGFKYPDKKEAAEVELVLSRIKDENGVSIKSKSFKDMTFEELTKYRSLKNHKMPWLWRQLYERGKEKEIKDYAAQYRWSNSVIEMALNYCRNNLN
mgnify:CR=1 FL=1